jgi:two-component system invasion response regulator UvrY
MSEPHKCHVAIVDDHQSFTDGLRTALKRINYIQLIGVYHTVEEYLPIIKTKKVDIVLMDIDIKYSSVNGIEATRRTLQYNPDIKVIAVSMHDDAYTVKSMLDAGACAYFTKDMGLATLKTVLEKVCNGESFISPKAAQNFTELSVIKNENKEQTRFSRKDFTDQEFEVMQLASDGKTDKEIAQFLGLTHKIVEYEKHKIYKKLNVHNVAEMVKVAFRVGLLK